MNEMVKHPPRPTTQSPEVRRIAAEQLAAEISEWLGEPLSESDVVDLTKMHWPFNGYDFAKTLERHWGIDPDAQLVEILDAASLFDAERKCVRDWVRAYNVTLELPDGTRVSTRSGPGTISGRDEKHAAYYVIPDAEKEKFKNGGGLILTPEKITLLEGVIA